MNQERATAWLPWIWYLGLYHLHQFSTTIWFDCRWMVVTSISKWLKLIHPVSCYDPCIVSWTNYNFFPSVGNNLSYRTTTFIWTMFWDIISSIPFSGRFGSLPTSFTTYSYSASVKSHLNQLWIQFYKLYYIIIYSDGNSSSSISIF